MKKKAQRNEGPLRQGDILLVPRRELPEGLSEIPRDRGRVVLAEGEETGHFHAIEAPEAILLAENVTEMDGRFLSVEAEMSSEVDAWRCRNHEGAMVWVPADASREQVEAADLTVLNREMVVGVPLRHDEHLPFVVTPGNYEVRRQREYSEAGGIRVVAD